MSALDWFLPFSVCIPVLAIFAVNLIFFFPIYRKEELTQKVCGLSFFTVFLMDLGLVALYLKKTNSIWTSLEESFFHVLHFKLVFVLDGLGVFFLVLSSLVLAIIAKFSFNYLHRERGYLRFFNLLFIFQWGLRLVFLSGSFELFFLGWELVEISSILLISFFWERSQTSNCAFITASAYRISDMGLVAAMLLFHHFFGGSDFYHGLIAWSNHQVILSQGALLTFCGFLLVGSLGKSAQLPFSFWLPRAMEGPTPSSAIFYGALSVHLGVFLLLRFYPFFEHVFSIRVLIFAIGLATSIHATLSGKVQANVKALLGFSTIAQVGVIFMEIGLGFKTFAVVHTFGNVCLRTLQFLSASNVLSDYQKFRLHHPGQEFRPIFSVYQMAVPKKIRETVYVWASHEFYLESLLRKVFLVPLFQIYLIFNFFHGKDTKALIRAFAFSCLLMAVTTFHESTGLPNPTRHWTLVGMASLVWLYFFLHSIFDRQIRISILSVLFGSLGILIFYGFSLPKQHTALLVAQGFLVTYHLLALWWIQHWAEKRLGVLKTDQFYGIQKWTPFLAFTFIAFGLLATGFPISTVFLNEEKLGEALISVHLGSGLFFTLVTSVLGLPLLKCYFALFTGENRSVTFFSKLQSSERILLTLFWAGSIFLNLFFVKVFNFSLHCLTAIVNN